MALGHYLLSLDLAPERGHFHAYLMTDDAKAVEGAANKLVDIAEKTFGRLMLPMILQTKLDKPTTKWLREKLCESDDRIRDTMKAATTFHYTVWATHKGDAFDKELMRLH